MFVCSCMSVCSPQVYMYAAWHGWVIPMFLFLAILRLSLNYLIARSAANHTARFRVALGTSDSAETA